MPEPLLALLQSGTVRLDVNPVTALLAVLGFAGTTLLAVIAFFIKRLIESLDAFKREVRTKFREVEDRAAGVSEQVRTVRQELVGIDGQNGLKGELRALKRQLQRTSRVTDRLAQEAGLAPDDDEEAA